MSEGFKYLDEEDFFECFRTYRGSVLNNNNSDYTSRKVNLFFKVDYDDIGDIIETTTSKIRRYFDNIYVQKITTDLDDSDMEIGLLFVDIFLKDNIPKAKLKEGLNLINDNL